LETALVRRRHVIYVPGYDPRGLAEYYRMFRTQFAHFLPLYGLKGTIARPRQQEGRFATTWEIDTEGPGWRVNTVYEFLRWEDIIRRDFARPLWWKVAHELGSFARLVGSGVFGKFIRAHWRFAGFVLYPPLVFVALLLTAALAGLLAAWILGALVALPALAAIAGIAVTAACLVALLRITESTTYLLYLFDDTISTLQFTDRQRPDWDERLDLFAGYLVERAQTAAVDEIVVVGHSSGSFLAIDVVARALARDPDLGRHGPRLSVLTVGANLPAVGFQPTGGWFRERLRRVAMERDVDWVEYQSRKDIMSFFPFDPVAGHGLDLGPERHNPTVVPISFHDIIKPESYASFRWRFFRVHFQFVMANERPAAYDYYMIVCGPFPLALRAEQPRDVLAAVAGDAASKAAAWERLRPRLSKQAVEPGAGTD
jgi:hypothetical protein